METIIGFILGLLISFIIIKPINKRELRRNLKDCGYFLNDLKWCEWW